MIRLRDYQETAVRELAEKSRRLARSSGSKLLVFKAPTGSGKTMMMAEYLKRLAESGLGGATPAFIWTAPRKLHSQSREKLEKYYRDSRALKPLEFDELSDRQIGEGEILFFNWESINREDNVFIRENEQEFNLSKVIERTREAGREIVLVIDEAHHAAGTENSRGLIEMMNPRLTINVSATPALGGDEVDGMVAVQREDVISEAMIKKQVLINPEFRNLFEVKRRGREGEEWKVSSDSSGSTDATILAQALGRREALKEAYAAEGVHVNPLLLVQLPDSRREMNQDYLEEVKRLLRESHGITTDNGRLAIYLSENKENLENLTRNDNEAEVMIFKQAIALGWDCPRASILCLFRDWRSFTFSTQTLGRILRMPELRFYENEELNSAYVYTSTQDLAILEEAAGDYITIQRARRRDIYKRLTLRSVHRKRQREHTRLNPAFTTHFMEAAKKQKLKKALDLEKQRVIREILTDGRIEMIDQAITAVSQGRDRNGYRADVVEKELDNEELQREFDNFAAESLRTQFFPEARSVERVKMAIYTFFDFHFPGNFNQYDSRVQRIVLDKENRQKVLNAINRAKELYLEQIEREERELESIADWEVPSVDNYNVNYRHQESSKAIMDPFFEQVNASRVEKNFARYMDGCELVKWWYKNGEQLEKYFAIPYDNHGVPAPFYVDWLVMFTDGRLGLFDTKGGITAESEDTKAKAQGLQKYIADENTKGKRLIGGILVEKDSSWRVNCGAEYSFHENDLEKWAFFEEL